MREITTKSNSSVDKTIELVNMLASYGPMSAADISEKLAVTKTTAYSLIRSCLDGDFIDRDPFTGRFMLGYKLFELGEAFQFQYPFISPAINHIRKIYAEKNLRVGLYVYRNGRSILIVMIDAAASVIRNWNYSDPAWASAAGRIFLSALSSSELEALVKKSAAEKETDAPRSLGELKDLLKNVKEQGYCVASGTSDPDYTHIAAPLYNYLGNTIASVCFQIPAERWKVEGTSLLSELKLLAATISSDLGYRIKT